MLFKITAISYLSVICSASSVFSQNFVGRDDRAEKILQRKTDSDPVSVQYAPLYSPEIHIRNEMDILPKLNVNENAEAGKKMLEPNLALHPHNSLPYVPGHNIEILQSVNRSPGLPIEYRSIAETTEASTLIENEKKMNYHRAFSVIKKPENMMTLQNHIHETNEKKIISPTNEPMDDITRIFKQITNPIRIDKYNPEPLKVLLDQQLLRNHQTMQDIHELTKQIESQRVVRYPKMNTMLLNLARVYSPRVPVNLVNYLDPADENGIRSSQQFIRSPSKKYTETQRSRAMPSVFSAR